jgi:PAS domain-containing protein
MADTFPIHPGLEALADGFFMLAPGWQITYWNGAAARFLQVPRDQALGRSLWKVVPELEGSVFGRKLREGMETGVPSEFLIPHLPGCCDGHYLIRTTLLDGGGIAVHIRDASSETCSFWRPFATASWRSTRRAASSTSTTWPSGCSGFPGPAASERRCGRCSRTIPPKSRLASG